MRPELWRRRVLGFPSSVRLPRDPRATSRTRGAGFCQDAYREWRPDGFAAALRRVLAAVLLAGASLAFATAAQAQFTVTNSNDSGAGRLRAAITAANTTVAPARSRS